MLIHRLVRWMVLFAVCWTLPIVCDGQAITDVMRPVPEAVTEDAPLPPAWAKRLALLNLEKQRKFVRSDGMMKVVSDEVMVNEQRFIVRKGEEWTIQMPKEGSYRILIPQLILRNTSHGHELPGTKQAKFNIKKDRLSYALLGDDHSLLIYNKKNNPCNMADFVLSADSSVFRISGNHIEVIAPVLDIARGLYPWEYKLTCTHRSSGVKYVFDLHLEWRNEISFSQDDAAYCLERLTRTQDTTLALLLNLKTKIFEVVSLPLTLAGDGEDGADGRKGLNGSNGLNEYSWTDSDGKRHYRAGTRGTPGYPGEPGEPGTNGSSFLFCLGHQLTAIDGVSLITPMVEGGQGGKGGKGGRGGMHGRGSGAYGCAPDGANGRDGANGKRGDFLFIEVDAKSLYEEVVEL